MQQDNGANLFSSNAWRAIATDLALSRRECDVLRAIFEDHTEFAISCDLRISPKTVHTYISRLYRKLGVSNRTQVLVCVFERFVALTAAGHPALSPICPRSVSCSRHTRCG